MKIKNWYELRGYNENCITRYLKKKEITINKLAEFLEINKCEMRVLCNYQDSEIRHEIKLIMSILDFMEFCGFSQKDFINEYKTYRESLVNPPF